jgi:hypothetical protein
MGGPRITGPLYASCRRPGCENFRQVRTRYEQRIPRYCSRACAASATADSRREACREACRKVGLARASQLRQQVLRRLESLTKLECFRLGFKRGLASKYRQLARKRAEKGTRAA